MKTYLALALFAAGVLFTPSITNAQTACTMQYQPVCGTEKGVYKTYGNGCTLGVAGAVYQHEGECTAMELRGEQEGTYTHPAHCTSWNDGCNSCSRTENGDAMCTLMACMGTPRAGYCTAYGDSEEQVATDPGTSVSSEVSASPAPEVVAEATTSATTTPEKDPGFFFSLWRAVAAWWAGLFS